MFIAYCSIIVAACLPYLWAVLAKTSAPGYNNKDPRGWVARQENYRVRNAYAAHLNAFEAFPAFAAAVLMAQFAGVDASRARLEELSAVMRQALDALDAETGALHALARQVVERSH